MKRYVLPLLALSLFLSVLPAHALPRQEPWIEVRTANFTLFSNAGEPQARRVGADLERLRDALAQLSPGLVLNSPVPTYVFVFKNAAALQPYLRTFNGQPLSSAGYFLSTQWANYVAVNGDRRGDEKGIVYHEYLHYVLRNNYASLPLWLHEGLAEYYSTFAVGKDEARIGLPVQQHVDWLRQHPLIPLAALLAVDERSPEYNESSRRGAFYAESWALVHYLISGNPERRRQAAELLRLAQTGTLPAKLFGEAFGNDPAALERELRTYVKSYTFNSTRLPLRAEANLAMEARPLPWADVLYRLGDLLANLSQGGDDHRAAAGEHFRAALAVQPNHGPALAGLGYLEELSGNRQEARALYEKAAQLAPDDFLIQYRYAAILLKDDEDLDSLRKARAALARAVRLRPDFGEAWAQLGYTYQREDVLPAEAVQALETAHRLLPSRMEIAYNLALAYARSGARQKAADLIETTLVAGADAAMLENAREALLNEDLRQAEELLGDQKLEEALPILEQVRAKTSRDWRRTEVTRRIDEVRKTLNFNHFVDAYNRALELANQGDVKGAIALLEPLVSTTQDSFQVEQARTLLGKLKGPRPRP
jgi:tetratricopeptide (TPR) repeat protein